MGDDARKAALEARRQKILARGDSRLAQITGMVKAADGGERQLLFFKRGGKRTCLALFGHSLCCDNCEAVVVCPHQAATHALSCRRGSRHPAQPTHRRPRPCSGCPRAATCTHHGSTRCTKSW